MSRAQRACLHNSSHLHGCSIPHAGPHYPSEPVHPQIPNSRITGSEFPTLPNSSHLVPLNPSSSSEDLCPPSRSASPLSPASPDIPHCSGHSSKGASRRGADSHRGLGSGWKPTRAGPAGRKQSASFLLVPFLTTSSQMLDSMHKTSTPGRRRAKGSWGQSEQLCSCELPHPGLVPSPLPAQESSHPAAFTSSAPSLTQPISFQSLWPLDRLRLSPLGPEWTSSLQTVKIKQKGDQEGRCPEQTKPLKPGWHGVWG